MRPTLRQLEYAVAVAEFRHFRKAAAACHVSQPALSSQIQALEATLGIRIFERDRRRVHVTAAGEQLLARARASLREVDDLLDLAAHLARPGTGPLRLGIIPTVAPYLLPGLLPALRDEHPDYDVQIWEAQTGELMAKLDSREVDLLVLALPIPGDDRPAHDLAREPFVLLTPEAHPLAKADQPAIDDLDGRELLLLADGHCLREHALAACELAGATAQGPMHANSLSMLVQLVRNGMGITLLPASAVPVELADRRGLAVRRFRDPEPSRILGAVWREESSRASELSKLCELVADQAGRQVHSAFQNL